VSRNVDRGIGNVSGSSGSQRKGEPKPIGYFAWNLAIRVPLIFSALRELGATSLRALQGEVNTISNKSTWPSSDEQMFNGIGDPLLDGKGSQRGGSMVASTGTSAIDAIRALPRLLGTRRELDS